MRKPDDLAIRARNWFWYWQVRSISGLSNYQLDTKCFGRSGAARKRYFERLEATAADPSTMAMVDGRSVLAVVDGWDHPATGEADAFKPATAGFRSKFWDFLTTVTSSPEPCSDFIQGYVAERGWVRLRLRDAMTYQTFYGQTGPAIEEGVSTAYRAMLHKLLNEQSLDAAAALIALFREAVHSGLLEQAIAIKDALTMADGFPFCKYKMPPKMHLLIWRLIRDRVFQNIWLSEADWRQNTGTPRKRKISTVERAGEFQEWVMWYISGSRQADGTDYGKYPIVPSSPRLIWLLQNCEQLDYMAMHIDDCEAEAVDFGKYHSELSQQRADSLLREAKELRSQVTPPYSADERFCEKDPPVTPGNLPRPY